MTIEHSKHRNKKPASQRGAVCSADHKRHDGSCMQCGYVPRAAGMVGRYGLSKFEVYDGHKAQVFDKYQDAVNFANALIDAETVDSDELEAAGDIFDRIS